MTPDPIENARATDELLSNLLLDADHLNAYDFDVYCALLRNAMRAVPVPTALDKDAA